MNKKKNSPLNKKSKKKLFSSFALLVILATFLITYKHEIQSLLDGYILHTKPQEQMLEIPLTQAINSFSFQETSTQVLFANLELIEAVYQKDATTAKETIDDLYVLDFPLKNFSYFIIKPYESLASVAYQNTLSNKTNPRMSKALLSLEAILDKLISLYPAYSNYKDFLSPSGINFYFRDYAIKKEKFLEEMLVDTWDLASLEKPAEERAEIIERYISHFDSFSPEKKVYTRSFLMPAIVLDIYCDTDLCQEELKKKTSMLLEKYFIGELSDEENLVKIRLLLLAEKKEEAESLIETMKKDPEFNSYIASYITEYIEKPKSVEEIIELFKEESQEELIVSLYFKLLEDKTLDEIVETLHSLNKYISQDTLISFSYFLRTNNYMSMSKKLFDSISVTEENKRDYLFTSIFFEELNEAQRKETEEYIKTDIEPLKYSETNQATLLLWYYLNQDYDTLLKEALIRIDSFPNSFKIFQLCYLSLIKKKQYKKAEKLMHLYISEQEKMYPYFIESNATEQIIHDLTTLYTEQGQRKKSIQFLEHFFQSDPKAKLSELIKQAQAEYQPLSIEEIKQKANTDSYNANALAYLLSMEKENLPRALAIAEAIIQDRPLYPYYIDTLAFVNYTMNDLDAAWKNIQTATRIEPGEAEMWEHYGDIASAMGKKEEAIKGYEMALSLDPKDVKIIIDKKNALINE